MSKEKSPKRKAVRRTVLIIVAAMILLSAVTVGMCLFNERPAVHTITGTRSTV